MRKLPEKIKRIKERIKDRALLSESNQKSRIQLFADWLDSWHLTRIFQSLSSFLLVVTLAALYWDFEDRDHARTV